MWRQAEINSKYSNCSNFKISAAESNIFPPMAKSNLKGSIFLQYIQRYQQYKKQFTSFAKIQKLTKLSLIWCILDQNLGASITCEDEQIEKTGSCLGFLSLSLNPKYSNKHYLRYQVLVNSFELGTLPPILGDYCLLIKFMRKVTIFIIIHRAERKCENLEKNQGQNDEVVYRSC